MLREKWCSILKHITNVHEWPDGVYLHKCMHDNLLPEEQQQICWLKPGSHAVDALCKVVMDKNLLKALPHLSEFCHTGELEVFHSLILKYCPKRQHFPYASMLARTLLAVLHWNSSTREAATNADGQTAYDVVYSKRKKSWILRPRYKPKTPGHVKPLLELILETFILKINLNPLPVPVTIPRHVPTDEKPHAQALYNSYSTKFAVA